MMAELSRRRQTRLASQSLIEFTRAFNPLYQPAAHHLLIARHLEAIERREIDRLMIFTPPRHGKSELASRRFPAWYLGRNPKRQVIAASYNADLAGDFGREVRNLIATPEYGEIFPGVELTMDSHAVNRMSTVQGGAYYAAGVGTAVTGRGADLLLIDDPIKDRAEADSQHRRDMIDDWYRSTAFTRLMPGGAVVLIQTRWHEDDLAGRLLERRAGEWTVVEMPALSEEGEALWPEWFDTARLARIREEVGPRNWSALYQQKPQPDEGTYFERDWLKAWKVFPQPINVYGTSDYAVTEGRGDYTVHQIWGIGPDGMLYRIDGWRGKTAPDEWIERKIDLMAKHKPFAWFGEGGTIRNSVEALLTRRMEERRTYCRLEWMTPIGDKPARARSFQGLASMGKVRFEPGADLSQYLAFPDGRNDDEVDASALIGRALQMAHPAIRNGGRPLPRKKDRWDRLFDEADEEGEDWDDGGLWVRDEGEIWDRDEGESWRVM